jgi:hypothetical protein
MPFMPLRHLFVLLAPLPIELLSIVPPKFMPGFGSELIDSLRPLTNLLVVMLDDYDYRLGH